MRFAADPSANGGSVGRILSRGSTRTTPPAGTEVAATGRTIPRARALRRKAGVRISAVPSSSSLALSPSFERPIRHIGTIAIDGEQSCGAPDRRDRNAAVPIVAPTPRGRDRRRPPNCVLPTTGGC